MQRSALFAAALLLLVGCSKKAAEPVDATPALAAGSPIDLHAVIERAHFSFRPSATGFVGGHDTYEAEVRTDGSARVRGIAGPALELSPAQLDLGGHPLASSGQPKRDDDGSLSFARGEVREQLRNTANGLEQTWHLQRAPGTGKLTVRIPVAGLRFAGTTEHGLHFLAADQRGFRYGHATFIDAKDQRHAILARWDGAAIVLEVPEDILAASAFPAVLDPVVTPEFGMDNPVYGDAAGNRQAPFVASNGSLSLVVWDDRRADNADIFAARVTATGAVLDPAGLLVAAESAYEQSPAVASDGTDFFVTWSSYSGSAQILGRRVTAAGAMPDAAPILVASGAVYSAGFLTFGAGKYFSTWADNGSGSVDVYATSISPAGVVSPQGAVPIATGTDFQFPGPIASNGTNVLITWYGAASSSSYDAYATVFDANLNAVGSLSPILTGAGQQVVYGAASDGTDFLVGMVDFGVSPVAVKTRKVNGDGTLGASATLTAASGLNFPRVAFTGGSYLVVYSNGSDLLGSRVLADGTPLDTTPFVVSAEVGSENYPSLARVGANALLVWQGDNSQIRATRMTGSTRLDSPSLRVSGGASTQSSPSIAASSSHYLVTWVEERLGGPDIRGVLVGKDGGVVDPAGIAICSATGSQWSVSAASDGTGFFVAWPDQRTFPTRIFGAHVSSAGVVQPPDGFSLAPTKPDNGAVAVASNGAGYLVAFSAYNSSSAWDLWAVPVNGVSSAGAPFAVSPSFNNQDTPTAASDGKNYLLAWQDLRNGFGYDVYAARVLADGTVVDPNGLALTTNRSARKPAAAGLDGGYLVVFSDRPSSGVAGIYGVRISPDAGVLDSPAKTIAVSGANATASVASDGRQFFVAYEHRVSGGSEPADIHGARVLWDGNVLDPNGAPLSATATDEVTPALAAGGIDQYLLAYRTYRASPFNSPRVVGRLVRANSPPVAQSSNVSTPEDTPLTLTLPASDADGDALTYALTSVTPSTLGSATLNGDSLTFTPAANVSGTVTIGFTASDALTSSTGSVTIVVQPVNDPPSISTTPNANATVDEMSTLTVSVTGSDVETSAVTLQLVSLVPTPPSAPTLSLTGTGNTRTWTWTPSPADSGSYVATFRVSDGTTTTDRTLAITVNDVNRAPIITVSGGASRTVAEDSQLTISLTVGDPDGDAVTVTRSGTATGLTPDADSLAGSGSTRTWLWTPNFDRSSATPYTVTFTASDGKGGTVSTTVTITVTNTNRAPSVSVSGGTAQTVAEGSTLSLTITLLDPDGDVVTATRSGTATGLTPDSDTFSGTGSTRTWTWTPGFNRAGSYTMTFAASDGSLSGSTTVNLTVTDTNRAPTLSVSGGAAQSVAESSVLSLTITAADADGDALTITRTGSATGLSPDADTLTGTGSSRTWTWTPGFDRAAGSPYTVTFVANDGKGGSASFTVTLTVIDVNRAPTVTVLGGNTRAVAEGAALTIDVSVADPDGDPVTLTASGTATGLTPDADALSGTGPSRTWTWTPGFDRSSGSPFTVTFDVSDGRGGSASSAAVTITVSDTNRAPTVSVSGGPSQTVAEDAALAITVAVADADGDALTVARTGTASGLSPDADMLSGTGAPRTWTWTPGFDRAAGSPYSVTFTVSDGRGGTTSETVNITVTNVNRPPTLEPVADLTVASGAALNFTVAASDLDGDALTLAATSIPPSASFNAATGAFDWTADCAGGDHLTLAFTATDGADTASLQVAVAVTGCDAPPQQDGGSGGGTEDPNAPGGCGCGSTGAMPLLGGVAALLLRRRRARRQPSVGS